MLHFHFLVSFVSVAALAASSAIPSDVAIVPQETTRVFITDPKWTTKDLAVTHKTAAVARPIY